MSDSGFGIHVAFTVAALRFDALPTRSAMTDTNRKPTQPLTDRGALFIAHPDRKQEARRAKAVTNPCVYNVLWSSDGSLRARTAQSARNRFCRGPHEF